ncbi:MAG: restriction endonuclease subunit S [Campylobacterales bacterium]|nr:restriction endonuclease subunit S [Campylobacterales bacterium]
MSSWRECKLGEVIEIIGGGTPKTAISEYWNGDIPWLSVVDFNTGKKYVSKTEKTITEEGLKNSSTKLLQENDIIISARGTVGALAMLDKPMTFNQSCYGVRAKENESTNDYIFYLLKDTVNQLIQISHGGVFDTITRTTFDEIDISLPPLEEQKAIAEVLSSLDDKIDLLHRQNHTLESLAQTLFRQWFIEEAKEEWEDQSLFDSIILVGGGTPKTTVAEYWDGSIGWLAGGDISSHHKGFIHKTEKTITQTGLEKSSAKLLPKYATVISARGTVGKYCLLAEPMAFSQSNYGVLPKFKDCYFFTYLLISHSVEELQAAAYGSVFDTITTKTFQEHNITLPNEKTVKEFEEEMKPYFTKIESNTKQIQTLENLRDTLLPKLLSGEARVEI